MIQHYIEQISLCGLFMMEQINHWEDYSEEDRTVLETTNYFEELVESIHKFKDNSGVEGQRKDTNMVFLRTYYSMVPTI